MGAVGPQKKWKIQEAYISPAYTIRWGLAKGDDLSS
ncbi:hypothetical protein ACJJIP_17770 [Microbulbifer sp. VTAC004]